MMKIVTKLISSFIGKQFVISMTTFCSIVLLSLLTGFLTGFAVYWLSVRQLDTTTREDTHVIVRKINRSYILPTLSGVVFSFFLYTLGYGLFIL